MHDCVTHHIHSNLFAPEQCITDVSGSGNNFAHGHCHHFPNYYNAIADTIRRQSEDCDALQSFHVCHSMGGGTGSGVGTGVLGLLEEEGYQNIARFCSIVFPATDANDVVTSAYNR